jgi:hypothetical protein
LIFIACLLLKISTIHDVYLSLSKTLDDALHQSGNRIGKLCSVSPLIPNLMRLARKSRAGSFHRLDICSVPVWSRNAVLILFAKRNRCARLYLLLPPARGAAPELTDAELEAVSGGKGGEPPPKDYPTAGVRG